MDTTNKWFDYLHNTRRLSQAVITEAQLSEDLGRLRIPIFDEAGNELFAKLRRPAESNIGPKYMYEKGGHAALYGINFSDLGSSYYFLEGELEVLAMRTMGLNGYSGTGGAMTFRPEWLGYVPPGKQSVILFDNDETGIKGAIRLAMLMEEGSYTWVPPMYGKDVSDLVMAIGPIKAKEMLTDPTRQVPFNLKASNQSECKKVFQAMKQYADAMDNSVGKQFLLQLAFDYRMLHKKRPKKVRHENVDNAVQNAKNYPIENLITFRNKKAKCLFHEEKTGSLHLYPDNHVYCHGGCARKFDAIDVYMQLHPGTKFLEAVNALNHLK